MFRKYRLSSVIIKVKGLFLCGLNIIKGSNLSDIPFGLHAKREWIREAKLVRNEKSIVLPSFIYIKTTKRMMETFTCLK